jgi:hypothetical protein
MGSGEAEEKSARKLRISAAALVELGDALRHYLEEVRNAGCARNCISETTVRTYTKGPENFVAWLSYGFALGGPSMWSIHTTSGPEITRKAEGLAAKKLRVSYATLAETEIALDHYLREVLLARLGERKTNQLGDHAEYFVRWLKYEFAPGSRKG